MALSTSHTRLFVLLGLLFIPFMTWAQFGEVGVIHAANIWPRVPAIADMNGDGKPDVVAGAEYGHELMWFESADGKRFSDAKIISSDTNLMDAIRAVDIDTDGDQDLFYLRSNGSLGLVLNSGSGAFGPAQDLLPADNSNSANRLRLADLDGDGDLDIAFARGYPKVGYVMKNTGNYQFEAPVYLAQCLDLDAGDIDQDGDTDLLLGGLNFLRWYPNDGTGSFAAAQTIESSSGSHQKVTMADMDGDGDLDAVTSRSSSSYRLLCYLNLGGGAFSAADIFAYDALTAYSLECADVDGDGDLDVVSSEAQQGQFGQDGVYIHLNDGAGVLDNGQAAIEGFWDYGVPADMDSDGDQDLIIVGVLHTVALWSNTGSGVFGETFMLTRDYAFPRRAEAADLDNDGDAEIVTSAPNADEVRWFENDGSHAFDSTHYMLNGSNTGQVHSVVGDLDEDGWKDLVASSSIDNNVYWYRNLAYGEFAPHASIAFNTYASNVTDMGLADLDGDGDLDVVTAASGSQSVRWIRNDGSGAFEPNPPEATLGAGLSGLSRLMIGDVDGDQAIDVISVAGTGLHWHRNNGMAPPDGTLSYLIYDGPTGYRTVQLGDLDADGDLDLLFIHNFQFDLLWMSNDGTGVFSSPAVLFTPEHEVGQVLLADVDNDLDHDLWMNIDSMGITLAVNQGGGSFTGTYQTLTTNVLSRHTFFTAQDVDLDSDLDLVYDQMDPPALVWAENLTVDDNTGMVPGPGPEEGGLRCFPVPVTNEATLISDRAFARGDVLRISDPGGRLLRSQPLPEGRSSLVVPMDHATGAYLLTVSSMDGIIRTLSLVVE